MMDDHEFRALVARHELDCRHQPEQFTRTTAALAGLGHAVILLVMLLAAVGLIWTLTGLFTQGFRLWRLFLLAGCGSLLWSIGSALWLRQLPPDGVTLTRDDAPRLFELIDKLCRRCSAPPVDVLMIDAELNASVVQLPRLGVLGWHRNHLVLGLPLLMALDVKQLAAVIAHEFGHLRGAHGKLGAWVYRTRRSWWMLAHSRHQAKLGANVADAALGLFFTWFFPRFNARAFVLSRLQEVEADNLAHQTVGRRHAASGLISLGVHGRYLQEVFWPDLWARARQRNAVVPRPMADMRVLLKDALRHEHASRWLREALKTLPEAGDTHPSLRDRLEHAEQTPALPLLPEANAADVLLGDRLGNLIETLDGQWQARQADAWKEAHDAHDRAERLLVELAENDTPQQRLQLDELLLWARTAWQVEEAAAARAPLRAAIGRHREPHEARYLLALALLDAACPIVSRSMAPQESEELLEAIELLKGLTFDTVDTGGYGASISDPHWALPAARQLESVLEQREAFEQLKPVRERLRKLEQEAREAREELEDFDSPQTVAAARVSPRVLRETLHLMKQEVAIGRAWLLRKTSPAARGWSLYLLVIERSGSLRQPDVNTWWETLRDRVPLPFPFMVIDLSHPFWADKARVDLVQQFREASSGLIYTASEQLKDQL